MRLVQIPRSGHPHVIGLSPTPKSRKTLAALGFQRNQQHVNSETISLQEMKNENNL